MFLNFLYKNKMNPENAFGNFIQNPNEENASLLSKEDAELLVAVASQCYKDKRNIRVGYGNHVHTIDTNVSDKILKCIKEKFSYIFNVVFQQETYSNNEIEKLKQERKRLDLEISENAIKFKQEQERMQRQRFENDIKIRQEMMNVKISDTALLLYGYVVDGKNHDRDIKEDEYHLFTKFETDSYADDEDNIYAEDIINKFRNLTHLKLDDDYTFKLRKYIDLPNLTHLELGYGFQGSLKGFVLPNLRQLVFRNNPEYTPKISATLFPKLEYLEIEFYEKDISKYIYVPTLTHLIINSYYEYGKISRANFPNLTHLELGGGDNVHEKSSVILDLPTLTHLDIYYTKYEHIYNLNLPNLIEINLSSDINIHEQKDILNKKNFFGQNIFRKNLPKLSDINFCL